jgi:pyruvate/2-oxoglutarate dehydrogenase complex dihydrolipoamide acyltransferase (E2) component
MATEITVPKLGWTMEEGTLLAWLVEDGASVTEGELIYSLETDKVENEIEAPIGGVIRIIGEPGEVYAVGALIAEIS